MLPSESANVGCRPDRCAALFGATSRNRDEHLVSRFGTEAAEIRRLIANDPTLGTPLVPGLPYLRAEAVYSARYESAATRLSKPQHSSPVPMAPFLKSAHLLVSKAAPLPPGSRFRTRKVFGVPACSSKCG